MISREEFFRRLEEDKYFEDHEEHTKYRRECVEYYYHNAKLPKFRVGDKEMDARDSFKIEEVTNDNLKTNTVFKRMKIIGKHLIV